MEYEFMHNITFIETFLSYAVANVYMIYSHARIYIYIYIYIPLENSFIFHLHLKLYLIEIRINDSLLHFYTMK